jgi:hypothetical protein
VIRVVRVTTLALGLSILAAQSRDVHAQGECLRTGARWCIVDALGYGAVGGYAGHAAGAGIERSFDNESVIPADLALMLVGGVVGFAAGWETGANAVDAHANGHTFTTARRITVASGAIPAGAILGAFVAYQMRRDNISGETALGSNQQATVILLSTGAALGAVYAWRFRHTLPGSKVTVSPLVTPQRFGVVVRKPF